MFKILFSVIIIIFLYALYQLIFPLNKIKMNHPPEDYFKSKKVQKFCYALIQNDFKTTDELLKKGLDINAIGTKVKNERESEYSPTILTWLFLANKDTPEKLKAFEYLLKHGANPIIPHDKYKTTMLWEAAGYEYPDYLKLILKYGNLKKSDLNIDLNTGTMNSPLLHAMAINRFENFKLLLDAGADMNWADESGRTTLSKCSHRGSWKFSYELLKRGVDYSKDLEDIKGSIESTVGSIYSPATAIDWDGTDWRQKVVQFFRKKGIEMKPGMPKDEKYVNENGEDVLYINEGIDYETGERKLDKPDKWIKISESTFYKKATKDPDQQKYLNKELEKTKIERLKD